MKVKVWLKRRGMKVRGKMKGDRGGEGGRKYIPGMTRSVGGYFS